MPFDAVIGQKRVKQTLTAALSSGRVAHAYLFHGPSGTGKLAAAFGFAQMLLCSSEERGCGVCRECDRVSRCLHPDVHLHFPSIFGKKKDVDVDDIKERLLLIAQDPYSWFDYARRPTLSGKKGPNKLVSYRAWQVAQDVMQPMSFKSVEGGYKVAIIYDAHSMGDQANAFLKLLEEPPANTVFILISDRPDELLPTITSRCQPVGFEPLNAADIEAALRDRFDATEELYLIASRMADGSFGKAMELIEFTDLLDLRELMISFLRHSAQDPKAQLPVTIESIASLGRVQSQQVLGMIPGFVRDVVVLSTSGDPNSLVNIDQSAVISNFARNLDTADFDAVRRIAQEAQQLIARNVNISSVLVNASFLLHDAMYGKQVGPLFTPLAELT